jgi:hypothetical protein
VGNLIQFNVTFHLSLDTRRCYLLQVDCSDIYNYFFNKVNGKVTTFKAPGLISKQMTVYT